MMATLQHKTTRFFFFFSNINCKEKSGLRKIKYGPYLDPNLNKPMVIQNLEDDQGNLNTGNVMTLKSYC